MTYLEWLALSAIAALSVATVYSLVLANVYARRLRTARVERDHWQRLYDEAEAEVERLAWRDDRPVRLLGRAAK